MIQSRVIFLGALFFFFVSLSCKTKPKDAVKKSARGEARQAAGSLKSSTKSKRPLRERASSRALENKRVFVGTVMSNRKVVISPQIGGMIQKIYVKKGDWVKKNARLVFIACRDYSLMEQQVQTQIAVAKAGLRLAVTQKQSAQREFKRFRRLYRKRSLSAYQMDKLKMALQLSKAQEVLARRRIQVAQVGLKIAQKRRRSCMTRAPFAGMVTQRMMDEGGIARAMPPSQVLLIEEVTPVVIEVPVGEMYLNDLRQATEARVIAPALGAKFLYKLTGSQLSKSLMPSINPYNRAATLRIKLANKSMVLKPGMSVELHVYQPTP